MKTANPESLTTLKNQRVDWLLFDISNLLYRTFYAQTGEDDTTLAGLATHTALTTLNKYFKALRPRLGVVMVFDRKSWRKEYTASDKCVSKKPYKGNRRKDMSVSQQAKYARFMNHLGEFERLIAEHTTIITLAGEGLEADDLLGGFCQVHSGPDTNIVLVSADGDMLQLLQYENVTIVVPGTDKVATLAEWNNDPDYFMFVKCICGDRGDNVQSALPRVRKTRLKKAYEDKYEMTKLLKETWSNEDGITFEVEQLFRENHLLMNLTKQPPDIRLHIYQTIEQAMDKERKFSMFFIMKFLHKYDLNRIKDSIDNYLPLLSMRPAS